MKKLMMFAATMTIVGGAFAFCSDPIPTDESCALVYDVTVSVKASMPKFGVVIEATECADGLSICYRVPGSRKFKGYLSACECTCEAFQEATLIFWEPKAKVLLADNDVTLDWGVLNLMGKNNQDIEGAFAVELGDYGVYAAGFGKFDQKNLRITSMSGNIVGVIPGPDCIDEVTCLPEPSIAFPCSIQTYGAEAPSVVFGDWSIKYNKSQSAKLASIAGYVLPTPNY